MFKEERGGMQKARSFHFRKMFDINIGRDVNNYVDDDDIGGEEEAECRKEDAETEAFIITQQITSVLEKDKAAAAALPSSNSTSNKDSGSNSKKDRQPSDMDLMKEKFSKLLLGEDMSGGGKGVSSALALSNAITNLAASVFGEQNKLEPMSADRKARWKKEIDWLLSVTDYIVEFVASQQKAKDGSNMEIMVTQQRRDLYLNIPALRKLDIMLIGILDNFVNEQEYKYVSKDADESERGVQREGKWWLPSIKVPPNGLSEDSRLFLQKQKESVNQVLKASMAINAQILSDMEIPESYIDSLPKNGRSSLGESIYRNITVEFFDPMQFLSTMDMSSEHKVLDLKNRIEASIVIWKRKMNHKDAKSAWGSAISLEKRELFEERAETILLLIKQQFPGIAQSSLEISKIQYNKDVGLSILESYSRVLESLANTVMSRILDVQYADSVARDPSLALPAKKLQRESSPSPTMSSFPSPARDDTDKLSSAAETPTSMTLSDFMGWELDPADEPPIQNVSTGSLEAYAEEEKEKEKTPLKLPPNITTKKFSYMDKIEMFSMRSPTARH